ncbi:hypothetical protein [Aquibacillus saliphilus]|uniref:hypothetical protein n=1 Tax=Aquibacillus saliphilus TaxID=1909422 RepID=UPI001CF0A944|nr:hypothetical protein [Aquibacillus saliphilus]
MDKPSARIDFSDDMGRISQIKKEVSELQLRIFTLQQEEGRIWARNSFSFTYTDK